ncbi:hypothetical protein ACHAXR_006889 [Thalassiosira sp. AJA248-18]
MNISSRSLGLPREGSKVRLIGLKNPDLNGKIGHISNYSADGERVMVSLINGPQGVVKVKPKQIEVLEEPPVGGANGGPRRRLARSQSARSARSASRDRRSGRPNNRLNGSQRNLTQRNPSRMNRTSSADNYHENGSRTSSHASNISQEVMETLRSADAMFDLADTSGDGVISEQEFEYYMKKHTNHDIEMIRECFYMIDVDHNGDITRDEVRNAFLKKRNEVKGGSMTEENKKFQDELLQVSRDADALFEKADVDGNGFLTIREFELYMKRHTKHSSQVIHHLFDSMDSDKDGYISREEVRKAYVGKKKEDGGKRTLMDLLGLEDEEFSEIEDDVYNMFFLADLGSQAFWFAIFVFVLKLSLIIIIAIDLFQTGEFPESSEVPALVRTIQFLLLPVNISVQEELITTFFVYANLKWSKHILELSPGATKGKYHIANLMRFLDGCAFLFINTTLLFQATQVLSAFLNFAALQFLSSIDNVALHLARDGYLTDKLEEVAGDVQEMRLPKNHSEKLQVLDSLMLAIMLIIMVVAWVLFMFVL